MSRTGLHGSSSMPPAIEVTDVFRNMLIIVIAAEEIASRIVEQSQALLENYAGIVVVSDVEIVRNEHF